jgi:hypothetical protein
MLQATAALPPKKGTTTPIKLETVWASGQVLTFRSRQKILTFPGIEPRFFAHLASGSYYIDCPISVICNYWVLKQMYMCNLDTDLSG